MIDFREKPTGYDEGIYKIPFAEYQDIPALNSSKLKLMSRTPAHFKARIDKPWKPNKTQQKKFNVGTVFDALILGDKERIKGGSTIIPAAMCKSAYKKKKFSDILGKGQSHLVLVWQCQNSDLWCKAEIDFVSDNGVLVDLKTTSDASYYSFSRVSKRLQYINQLAHYLDGLSNITGVRHDDAYLAVVETEPPFESHVFKPSWSQIREAHEINLDRKYKIYDCLESGKWPGYQDDIISLENGSYIE
jgi:hypothetical protein